MTLDERRKLKRLTQEDVAKYLGLRSRSTVSKWETGEFLPSTDNLIKLSSLYDCTIDDLLEISNKKTEKLISTA